MPRKFIPRAMRCEAKLTEVEEAVYQVRNRSGQDPLNFPIKLNNKIGHLLEVIEGGQDAKPTDQTYAAFKELSAELDVQLAKLKSALTTDLPAFNSKLTAANLATRNAGGFSEKNNLPRRDRIYCGCRVVAEAGMLVRINLICVVPRRNVIRDRVHYFVARTHIRDRAAIQSETEKFYRRRLVCFAPGPCRA